MIVNVNPYDTGYDENSHVMKFAALAREVYINPTQAPVRRLPPPNQPPASPTKKAGAGASRIAKPSTLPSSPQRRKVTISKTGGGKRYSEAFVEVLEGNIAQSQLLLI